MVVDVWRTSFGHRPCLFEYRRAIQITSGFLFVVRVFVVPVAQPKGKLLRQAPRSLKHEKASGRWVASSSRGANFPVDCGGMEEPVHTTR